MEWIQTDIKTSILFGAVVYSRQLTTDDFLPFGVVRDDDGNNDDEDDDDDDSDGEEEEEDDDDDEEGEENL